MIDLKSQKLLDETTGGKWKQFVHPSKIEKGSIMARKKKSVPFHIKHNMREFKLPNGTKFWARNNEDALLYAKKVGGGHADLGTDGKYFHVKGEEY
jgi:hypothetical protein